MFTSTKRVLQQSRSRARARRTVVTPQTRKYRAIGTVGGPALLLLIIVALWVHRGNGSGTLHDASALGIDSSGKVYVFNDSLSTQGPVLETLTATGKVIRRRQLPSEIQYADQMVIDRDGTAYVSQYDNRVFKIPPHSPPQAHQVPIRDIDFTGIQAIDAAGNMYGTTFAQVDKFSPDFVLLRTWGSFGNKHGQYRDARGVGVDHAGNIYVVSRDRATVVKLDPNGRWLAEWDASGDPYMGGPDLLALDSHGDVYVMDIGGYMIIKLSPRGQRLARWTIAGACTRSDGLCSRTGIAVDNRDNVYTLDDSGNRIVKLSSRGKVLATWQ